MKIERGLSSILFEGLDGKFKHRSDYVKSFEDFGDYIEVLLADHIDIERGFMGNIYCDFSMKDVITNEVCEDEFCQSYSDMLLVYSRYYATEGDCPQRILTFYR